LLIIFINTPCLKSLKSPLIHFVNIQKINVVFCYVKLKTEVNFKNFERTKKKSTKSREQELTNAPFYIFICVFRNECKFFIQMHIKQKNKKAKQK
jgi:hypothetical protein